MAAAKFIFVAVLALLLAAPAAPVYGRSSRALQGNIFEDVKNTLNKGVGVNIAWTKTGSFAAAKGNSTTGNTTVHTGGRSFGIGAPLVTADAGSGAGAANTGDKRTNGAAASGAKSYAVGWNFFGLTGVFGSTKGAALSRGVADADADGVGGGLKSDGTPVFDEGATTSNQDSRLGIFFRPFASIGNFTLFGQNNPAP